jgi:hypothetical protein
MLSTFHFIVKLNGGLLLHVAWKYQIRPNIDHTALTQLALQWG